MIDVPGHAALRAIDQVLAEQPQRNGALLSAATVSLTEFRDRLIVQSRDRGLGGPQRKQLRHVNAVITVVLGIHYPAGEVPWPELPKARDWLAEAVGMTE